MEEKLQEDILSLITRNLAGAADSFETNQLKDWIGESDSNRQYFVQVKNIWNAYDKQIDPQMINTSEALKKVLNRVSIIHPKRTIWYYWQKVAALLILPMAIGSLLWIYLYSYRNSHKATSLNEPVYNEVYAAFGTRSALRLSDSTLVWLNSSSSLRYPNKFRSKQREVYLKGEAYFEVKSNVSHPFVVHTSDLQVTARGTKFNVFDYPSEPVTEVTLVSGKVSVKRYGDDKSQLISDLNPGQHLEFNRQTGEKSIVNGDSYKYIAWKDGKLIFRNEPLAEVLNKIALIFNVEIQLQGKKLQDYRYHATFQEESFDEILKLLKLSSPIDYKELARNPLPDGSFPKKKIVIFPARR